MTWVGTTVLRAGIGPVAEPLIRSMSIWPAHAADLVGVVRDDRQRQAEDVREVEVVEAGECDRPAELPHGADGALRQAVVGAEQRRRRVRRVEQRPGGGLRGGHIGEPAPHPALGRFDSGALVRGPVAAEPLRSGVERGRVAQETDAAVAVRDELSGGLLCAAEVVDQNAVGIHPGGRPGRQHDRHAAQRRGRQMAVTAARRDDDHAVDLTGRQVLHEPALLVDLFRGVAEQHPKTVLGRHLLHTERQTRVERVGEVGDDQPDHPAAAQPQTARRLVAPVAERLDGGEHALARRLADPGVVLEYPGDGHGADTGAGGHVAHRRGGAVARPVLCHGRFSCGVVGWPVGRERRHSRSVPGERRPRAEPSGRRR